MIENKDSFINNVLEKFEKVTKKPENFLRSQNDTSSQVKILIKNVYDFTKNNEDPSVKVEALPELITQDFDEEQIWQQLELQNNGRWPRFLTDVSKFVTNKNSLNFPFKLNEENGVDKNETSDYSNDEDSEEETEEDNPNAFKSDSESEESNHENSKRDSSRKPKKSSIVDDKFFKLNDLEKFLDMEDRKAMQEDKPKKSLLDDEDDESDDSEESVDLFNGIDDEDMLDDKDEDDEALIDNEGEQHLRNPKFKDFFDAPDDTITGTGNNKKRARSDGDESDNSGLEFEDADSDDAEIEAHQKKRVRFLENKSNSESESEEIEIKSNPNETDPKSTFEIRQERLAKKIGHLEKAALEEKSWQFKGEVKASKRPENSLLEEIVEFNLTSRPAPVITEETTLRLEDLIKQRIKDKAWDDVERKVKPVDTITEYKKKLVLDQEKSKESLAQVYEQEYLKQQEAMDPDAGDKPKEEPKEHIEIREMMTSLFSKLDALSNFHYTPKTAAPELKIVTNLPAISMEEVAPVATSDAAMLAPEQIKSKTKGDILGKGERTATDKKRERRQKKIKQKVRAKQREEREQLKESQPGGNKFNKNNAKRLLDKVTKSRNTQKMDIIGDGKTIKSSTKFFSQLQDQVTSHINSKRMQDSKNKKPKKYSY